MSNRIFKILLLTIIGSLYGGRELESFKRLISRRPLDVNEATATYFDIPENEQEEALKALIKNNIMLPGLEDAIRELQAKLKREEHKQETKVAKESGAHEVAARKFEANEPEIHKLTEELNELMEKTQHHDIFINNKNMGRNILKLKLQNKELEKEISDLNNKVEEKSKSSGARTQRALQFQKMAIKNLINAKKQLENEKEELQQKINGLE